MGTKRTPVPVDAKAAAGDNATSAERSNSDKESTAEASAPEPEPTPGKPGESIEARVLVAFDAFNPNDVITKPEGEIRTLHLDGKVDPDPAAVDYAKSLRPGR